VPDAARDESVPIAPRPGPLRVALLGAESTGKTTLAEQLADHYETLWVPEYGAVYEQIGRERDAPWTTAEFVHIARIRDWLEDFLAGSANRVLFCDTESFVTARWHERLVGTVDATVEQLADNRTYDLYLVCDVETPFAQDEHGFRVEGPHRREMHDAYLAYVERIGARYVEVRGSPAERLATATAVIDELLSRA
jgi:HTH-type transcriptional repressor of NAD biosynthesis genes